jgi:predicted PurR-regulated permease PerM
MTTLLIPPHTQHSSRFRFVFWLVAIVLFFVFISLIKSILLPFIVGIFAAYFLDPAVQYLRRRGWSRTVSAGVITITFFFIAIAICTLLAPPIMRQLSSLIHDLPDYLQSLQIRYSKDIDYYMSRLGVEQVDSIKDVAGNFSGSLVTFSGKMVSDVVQSGLALLNILSLIFLTPVVAFYLLRDWDRVILQFDQLLPRDNAPTIRTQLHAIDRTLAGFIRGQTNVCLIMASFYGIALSVLGLRFGLIIGIMTGLFLFIPFIGFAIGFVLSLTVALFQFGDSTHIITLLAIYAVGQIIESSILTPRLVGGKVGLHPLWIIFGMLSGAALFGFIGVLISVPVTAVVGVLVRFAINRYLHSSLYCSSESL